MIQSKYTINNEQALKLCEDMIDANENVTMNELHEAIGKSFPQSVLDTVQDQIDDLLIKKGTTEGLIQKTLKITTMNPKIQYLKLKRQLTKQFGAAKFNQCKARVKKILDRQLSLMRGVQVQSDAGVGQPLVAASDSSLMKQDGSNLRKAAMRRRNSALTMSRSPKLGTSLSRNLPPGIVQNPSAGSTASKKKTLKRAASAKIRLASLKSRERRNLGGVSKMDSISEMSPSPYAVPSRAAPELHRTFSIESKDGLSGDTKIGNAVELVFLVRLKDVLVKNRGGLSSVQDYNEELMKAMQWLNSNVLDVARKDKGEAPASMCAVRIRAFQNHD